MLEGGEGAREKAPAGASLPPRDVVRILSLNYRGARTDLELHLTGHAEPERSAAHRERLGG
jgi:hypothetical protein